MSDLLLATKLYIPSVRVKVLTRQRLLDLLDTGAALKLVLISAPAGFGKTTLISRWCRQTEIPTAWLSLDEGDNDVTRFLNYFIAALQTTHPNTGEVTRALLSASQVSPEKTIIALINEIAANPQHFSFVLDDYHLIKEQAIHNLMTFLIDHQPSQMHLVIVTRTDPPLPISRLRARGNLLELRSADLRFNDEEAADFLKQLGIHGSNQDISALTQHTEGWAAGLQMAAVSMLGKDSPSISNFIQSFTGSNRYILDYLIEEVLNRQSEELQKFLLQTSILERLCGSLCDALTGGNNGQSTLEYIERNNLFVIPLDDKRQWYRYHHLFAELLRQHLSHSCPGKETVLHQKASLWYENQQIIPQAVEHALAAKDYQRATKLIDEIAENLMMHSEIQTLINWIERLPKEMILEYPVLGIYRAAAILVKGGSMETVEKLLTEASQAKPQEVAGEIATLRSLMAAFQGDSQLTIELTQQALEQLPEKRLLFRSLATTNLGIAYAMDGDIDMAIEAFEQAIAFSEKNNNTLILVIVTCQLAETLIIKGKLYQAFELYQKAVQYATDSYQQLMPIAGMALIGMAAIQCEWNNLDVALELLEKGRALVLNWGFFGDMDGNLLVARIHTFQGNLEEAQQYIDASVEFARNFDASILDDQLVMIHQVRFWIYQDKLELVERWARQKKLLHIPSIEETKALFNNSSYAYYYLVEFEYINMAYFYCFRQQYTECLEILNIFIPLARTNQHIQPLIEMLALQAIGLYETGQEEEAVSSMEETLGYAEPENYMRIFLNFGDQIKKTLEYTLRKQLPGSLLSLYIQKILDTLPAPGMTSRQSKWSFEELSEREEEVLKLVASGLSNQEIAERLFVATSTIKTHLNNVYRKLGVTKRTQALARARELNIIP